MSEVSMLVYPWDVQRDGPERVVDELAGRGITRIEIATAYHSAEVIAPRRTSDVATVAEANTVHLPLPDGSFSGPALPPSSIASSDPELYPRLKQAADAAGLQLGAWAIAFHNTDLATREPELAIVSCFGDRFTHGLCPANPRARRFAVELLSAVAGTGLFDRVLVESLSYLLYAHGHPHELWGARLDATTRYLLSLCFCVHCVAAAEQRGIDAEAVRHGVAQELHRSWNTGYPAGRKDDDGAELASMHFVWPELAAYTRMRMDTVTSLLCEVTATVRSNGALLDVSAAVWGRPAPTNWLEGVDVAACLREADGFVLESYFPDAAEVAREIDHTRAIAALVGSSAAPLSVALTLWPSFSPTRDDFLSKVHTVKAGGAATLALYNYGTAPEFTLDWVGEASAVMRRATS